MSNASLIDMVLAQELKSYFSRHLEQYDELRQIINTKSTTEQPKSKTLPSLRGLEYVVTYLSRYKRGQGFYVEGKNGERFHCDVHKYVSLTLSSAVNILIHCRIFVVSLYKTTLGTCEYFFHACSFFSPHREIANS